MRQPILTGIVASLLFLVASTQADVTVVDPRYSAVIRSTTVQPFPLKIGPGGAVYTVTGTSVNDDLVRVNPDGSIQVLNPSVGRVVGVGADLEFGFGGDLFANMGTDVIATPDGVARFNSATGSSSDFYVNEIDYGDGGLAFDASRQRLFMTNEERDGIVSIDSAGNGIVIAPSVGANPWGMAQQSTGRLIVLDRIAGALTAVDPDTGVTSTLAQLGPQLPNHQFVAVDVDKSTDEIYFIGAVSLRCSPCAGRASGEVKVDRRGLGWLSRREPVGRPERQPAG